jgi:PST family polysaccharide transporter
MVSLKQKTVSGVLWTGIAKMSMQGILFGVTIILARLLSADAFGIISIAAIVGMAVTMVNDRGLGTAIVQRTSLKDSYLSSVFWGGIVFGILIFSLFYLASFPMAYFFKRAIIQKVVSVMASGFVIGALGIVQKSLLTKAMDFKKLAIIEMIAVLVSAIAAVVLALIGAGVWSLVALMLGRDIMTIPLLWIFCPWKPGLHFSWQEFKELFRFSAQVLGNDVATYVISNTDITIIGRILGVTLLGYYSWAMYMIKIPITRLSGIVSKVVFPAFSSLQSDLAKFKKGFLKATTMISMITFPLLAGIGLFSKEIILLFVGEKWMPAQLPLVLLVPMGMLKSVGTIKGSVLMACGRPDIELKWNIFYFIVLLGAVFLGTRFGLTGVAAAFTILYLLTFPVIQTITNRQVRVSGSEYVNALIPAATAVLIMSVLVAGFRFLFASFYLSSLWTLILGGLLAMGSYLSVLRLFFLPVLQEFFRIVRKPKAKMVMNQEESKTMKKGLESI